MNKDISFKDLIKGNPLSKLPKSIKPIHIILMVVCVILLALTIYFAVAYFGSVSDRNDKDKLITQKQQQINAIGGMQNIGALQSQLEQALEDVIEESPFPAKISNTDVAYSIIEAARSAAIACYQYSSSRSTMVNLNTSSYQQNNYAIQSQGAADSTGEKTSRIINFLKELEESYDTSSITGLTLSDGDGDGEWLFGFTYSILTLPE